MHSNKLTCCNVLPVTLKVHLNPFIFRIVKQPKLISRFCLKWQRTGADDLFRTTHRALPNRQPKASHESSLITSANLEPRNPGNAKSIMLYATLFLLSNLVVVCLGWQALPSAITTGLCAATTTNDRHDEGDMTFFERKRKRRDGPWIAVLTEPDACDSEERVEETLSALKSAISSRCVDLVSIRVSFSSSEDFPTQQQQHARLISLIQRVKRLKGQDDLDFILVVNDNIDAAIDGGADGVHVKEKFAPSIQSVRQTFIERSGRSSCIIGTSCHSIESALQSDSYRPDYLFVGTCYLTKSHPEKTAIDMLEGPELPGKVKRALSSNEQILVPPIIFAIGGIDEINAKEPIALGADGVAAIRSILCASEPAHVAKTINKSS